MRPYNSKSIIVVLLIFTLAGCNKNPELTVLQDVEFNTTPTASTSDVELSDADSVLVVVSFNWEAAVYPTQGPVDYYLQYTRVSDTAEWNLGREMEVGEEILSVSLTGNDLNEVADDLGLAPGEVNPVAFRIKAYVDRYAYSAPVVVNVTPFEIVINLPSLWIPGDYQGWDPASAPRIVSLNDDGIYEGYFYIPPGGTNEFKITAQKDWAPVAYGDGGGGNLVESNNSSSDFFSVPSEGYYLLAVDLNRMIFLLMKTEWGIIGSATPGGWDADTEMQFNENTQVWSVTANMITAGSFKFRANKAWILDFGIDADGNLIYANHPWKPYVTREELTVPSDGNYTMILDLSEPGNYTYSIN